MLNCSREEAIEMIEGGELQVLEEAHGEGYVEDCVLKEKEIDDTFAIFEVRGKTYKYAKYSLWGLSEHNCFRRLCVQIQLNRIFKYFVEITILLNAILLAMADYSDVDEHNNLLNNSGRNRVLLSSDPAFAALFVFEVVVKVIAMGFYSREGGCYFNENWNKMDFVVAISSVISLQVGHEPGTSSIRAIRAVRPIRLLQFVPGINVLIGSLVKSLPEIANVGVITLIFMFLYATFGVVIFGGPYLHSRCRLTPYPVNRSWVDGLDPEPYRCIDGPTFIVTEDEPTWKYKSQSTWFEPMYCYWPIDQVDPDNRRWCSLPHSDGRHQCPPNRWCGSNFDALGNARFYGLDQGNELESYLGDLNWGLLGFDNIGYGFMLMVQIMTNSGWDSAMHSIYDARGSITIAYFIFLSIFGTFGIMQMFLAVMGHSYQIITEKKLQLEERKAAKKRNPGYIKMVLGVFAACITQYFPENSKKSFFLNDDDVPFIKKIVKSKIFNYFVNAFIFGNAIVLAIDHYPSTPTFSKNLEITSFILLIGFTSELVLKLLAFGFFKYFENEFNILDCVVVVISIVDLTVNTPSFLGGADVSSPSGNAIRALRLVRIFRLFKAISSNKKLKILVQKLYMTGKDLRNFGIPLFAFLFVYAIIGMGLFANRLRFDEYGLPVTKFQSKEWHDAYDIIVPNFDDFTHSFALVFQILTCDELDSIYPRLYAATGPWSLLFLYTLILFGVFMLFELFKAIILGNFELEDDEVQEMDDDDDSDDDSNAGEGENVVDEKMIEMLSEPSSKSLPLQETKLSLNNVDDDVVVEIPKPHVSGKKKTLLTDDDVDDYLSDKSDDEPDAVIEYKKDPKTIFQYLNKVCAIITMNPFFQNTLMVVTVLSALALAWDNPLNDPNGPTQKSLSIIDTIVFVFFLVECVIKITAIGFYSCKKPSYITDSWNILDMFILLISGLTILSSDPAISNKVKGLRALRSIRALKVMRVLKFVRIFDGLRLVISTLLAALPDVIYNVFLCLILMFIFAMFCVSFWKGQLKSCSGDNFDNIISASGNFTHLLTYPITWSTMTDEEKSWFGPFNPITNTSYDNCAGFGWPNNPCCPQFSNSSTLITSRQICECWGGSWENVVFASFDNVAQGIFSVFQMSTFSNWVEVMYAVTSNTGIDMQPIVDSQIYWIYFFVFLELVCGLFALNLFLGSIVDNYSRLSKRHGSSPLLTADQAAWVRTQKMLIQLKPILKAEEPKNIALNVFYRLKNSKIYLFLEFSFLFMGLVATASIDFGQSDEVAYGLFITNVVCSVYAFINLTITLISYRKKFFTKFVNIFDVALCVLGDAFFIKNAMQDTNFILIPIGIIRLLRVFRIWQILNSLDIPFLEGPLKIMRTLVICIPGMFNVGCIFFLMLFIYASMGVQLFAKIGNNESYNDDNNFRKFWSAFFLMFQIGIMNEWPILMHDAAYQSPDCVPDPAYNSSYCGFSNAYDCIPLNGCGSIGIYPFFVTFVVIVSLVILNLIVAIVVDTYDDLMSEDNNVTLDQLREYRKVWAEFDPNATKLLDLDKVPGFLSRLQRPLGCYADDERLGRVLAYLSSSLSVIDNKVHFRDLLVQLAALFEKKKLQESGKNTSHVKLPSKKHIFGLKYKYLSKSGDQTKFLNVWTDVPGSKVDELSLDANLTTLVGDTRVDFSDAMSEGDEESNLDSDGAAFVDDLWRDVPDKYSGDDNDGDEFYISGSDGRDTNIDIVL